MPPKFNDECIAIVYPASNFDSIPSLCNLAILLAQEGYTIEIFTQINNRYTFPEFSENNIHIIALQSDTIAPLTLRSILNPDISILKTAIQLSIKFSLHVFLFIKSIWKQLMLRIWSLKFLFNTQKKQYRCIIGVDPHGLIEAKILSRFVKIPLVYYSLELLLSNEIIDHSTERLKKQEKEILKTVRFVIIQDLERAELFAKDNDIPSNLCVLVPNAPMGPARKKTNKYWHQKFGLPSHIRVVLHSGGTEVWTGIDTIVESVKTWPDNWVLVIHTRQNAQTNWDIKKLQEKSLENRVFFSLQPVPRDEYDMLVDGADIGIAFYVKVSGSTKTQQNILSIGLSSGKIAYYLYTGLPVICNEDSTISQLILSENCGYVVKSPIDIGKAITIIDEKYDEYSRNAIKSFEKNLNVKEKFLVVLRKIDDIQDKQVLS